MMNICLASPCPDLEHRTFSDYRSFLTLPSLANRPFSCYTFLMSVTQAVEIPANHRLTIDVPREVPVGPVILTFTPAKKPIVGKTNRTLEDALRRAAEKAADPNRRPLSYFFGILSPNTYGDGVAYQRAIRNEWDD